LGLARYPEEKAQFGKLSEFMPTLWVAESGDRVRLGIDGLLSADGPTLQDAADELVRKILAVVLAIRFDGLGGYSAGVGRPNLELVRFILELGDFAAEGGDIRERLFGPSSLAA
jgi:hypothetical protein